MAAVISFLADGDGAMAVAELRALDRANPDALTAGELHYWLGLSYLLAFDWSAAAHEFRAYLTLESTGRRAGWAYLHLGRTYEQAGRTDEASLAYRGCLSVQESERAARRLAFDRMTRLVANLPMGYGQAPTRPAS